MILGKDKESVSIIAQYLKQGEIVILPTDTVYGFSGIVDLKSNNEIFNTDAKIRSVKGRSESKPLIQLIANPNDIYNYTDDNIPDFLLDKWPGALTLIVNVKKDSPLQNLQKTVAFRCPGDEWLRNIIAECNAPLYSTSVNRSGCPVLENIADIKNEFSRDVKLIVDEGDKTNALPSTIVSLADGSINIIRQGSVKI